MEISELRDYIDQVLAEIKSKEESKSPLTLNPRESYDSVPMRNLVQYITNNFDGVLLTLKSLIEQEVLSFKYESIKKYLSIFISSSNLKTLKEDILTDYGVILEENELDSSDKFLYDRIRSTFSPISDQSIEYFFEGRIASYKYIYQHNNLYKAQNKSFIIACLLIENDFNEYLDPISNVSNEYGVLIKRYADKGINLNSYLQFSKYDLILLSNHVVMLNLDPPRIYDEQNDLTIFLNGIEKVMFDYLQKKYDGNFNLSLKPSSQFFLEGKYELVSLLEHIETGKYFDLNEFGKVELTKLYSDDYETLWINIDKENITFEELINDYRVFNDLIVTQVVHSQYILDQGNLYITHLDHEFIFYTLEEYNNRQCLVNEKGQGRKRIKTFKIDNAMINVDVNNNILYDVLLLKFKNLELLKEYFKNVPV